MRALINKVVKGPQIRTWENSSRLAHDMKSCALNSDHIHYKAVINSMDTLRRIVMRLLTHLQAKWAKESNKLIEAERGLEFSHFASFVERRMTVANTAFAKLVGARLKKGINPKFWHFCDTSRISVSEWCMCPRRHVTWLTCPQSCCPRFKCISLLPVLQRHAQFGKIL